MTIPSTPVFKDPVLDESFRRDGYVVTPLLGATEVRELLELHDALTPDLPRDYYATIFHPDYEHRRQVGQAIDAVVQPRALPLLVGYKRTASAFISKRGETRQGRVPMHQDYTFVDQERCTGVHVWIPLIDVDEDNGCLTIYPGTHSLVNHISAIAGNPSPYDPVRALLEQRCGVRMPMAAGAALFFNERTLHGSEENVTPGKRVAVNCAYIPEQETMRVYCRNQQNPETLDVLTVHDPAALQLIPGRPLSDPYADGISHAGTTEYRIELLTPEQIRPLYSRQTLEIGEQAIESALERASESQAATDLKARKKSGLFGWLSRRGR